ncbi:MAG: hypothetical protein PIR02_00810 [Microbacterium enclense]
MNERSGRSPKIPGRARSRARVLQGALVSVALVAALTACASRPGSASTETPTAEPTPTASASVSPTPAPTPTPTATDEVQPEPVATEAGPASVTIVNVGADGQNISASGLVTGIVESGGVCTLTATSVTGRVLTGSVDAVSTPAAVNCGIIDIPAPAGEWSVVLEYRSTATSAVSEPVTVSQP